MRPRSNNLVHALLSAPPIRGFALCVVLCSVDAFSQSQETFWSGQAQCQLTVQSGGYAHQETQTWKLTGAPPTMFGAIAVYPANWSATGQGTTQRTVNTQAVAAMWKITTAPMNGKIAIFVRASDNRLIIKTFNAQLYSPGGVTVVRQISVAGATPSQSSVQYPDYEWPFPIIEDSATSTNVSGSGSVLIAATSMPMQSGSSGTATCSWQFTKSGGAVSAALVGTQTGGMAQGQTLVTTPLNSTSTSAGTGANCQAPSTWQGSSSPANTTVLGSISAGTTITSSSSLGSVTDSKFYQVSLPPGVDAKISLSGMQAGSDFDLYVYNSSLSPIGCSLNTGTAAETFQTQLGNTQTSNNIFLEVGPRAWSAGAPTYSLTVTGTSSNTLSLASSTQNRAPIVMQQALPNSATGTTSNCQAPSTWQGSSSRSNPTVLGSISTGTTITSSSSLGSVTDSKFYQVSLPPGVDVNITVSGMQAGSDFDLYVYSSNFSPIGCSLNTGTAAENFQTQLGNTQTSNTVLVEVGPRSWSAGAPAYSLTVSGISSNTLLLGSSTQNRAPILRQQALPNTSTGTTSNCQAPSTWQGAGSFANPTVLGTIQAGASITTPSTLSSASDRKIYQVSLPPGVDANISLSGMQAGSDFDFYVYNSNFSPIGCSLNSGTAAESFQTQFGNTQTSNSVLIEVGPRIWSANAPNFTLIVSGTASTTAAALLWSTTATALMTAHLSTASPAVTGTRSSTTSSRTQSSSTTLEAGRSLVSARQVSDVRKPMSCRSSTGLANNSMTTPTS